MTQQRFVLISLVPPLFTKEEAEKDLEELKSLVLTFGGATIVEVIQRREYPDKNTFIGKGKIQEVVDLIKRERIGVVVINSVVKSTQLFEMTKMFWASNPNIQVWDRVDLILHIFEKHAKTSEAKLQIELARMRHMGPRIYGLGSVLSRQGGGIGTRGIGETNIELMKRHWRDATKRIQDELKKLINTREQQLFRRQELGLKTASIVGYTNAGKSTLFNVLTRKNKIAKDVLFATLESTVGRMYVKELESNMLVSDTIGFIQNLPAKLIDAFKSTLMESIHASLLLQVIDASDEKMFEKIEVVENVLRELGINDKKRIFVFNKIDKAVGLNRERLLRMYSHFNPQFISVKTNEGIDMLKENINKAILQA
jgi:GTP-binding protein HflX